MFRINYVPSTSHWIFPPIIIKILVILLIIMFFIRLFETRKKKITFFDYRSYHFFEKNWDKLKLMGTLVLFILYIYLLDIIGFLAANIFFVFLFNLLFTGVENFKEFFIGIKNGEFFKNVGFKSVFNSIIISVVFSVMVWLVFGQVFQITLP